jgi:HAD superfamily hydrolase (TIGR01509 family)
MSETKIRGLLFDLDGVIIDSEQYYDIANSELFSEHGKVFDRDSVKPLFMGRTNKEFAEAMIKQHGLPLSVPEFLEKRKSVINHFYKEKINYLKGFEDFFEALTKKVPCKKAIVTGCAGEQFKLIDSRINLTKKFDGNIFRAEDLGKSKPSPDIYLHAAEKLEVPIKDCVVFEDAPSGIISGYSAGAKVVALTTTLTKNLLIKKTLELDHSISFGKILVIDGFNQDSFNKVIEFIEAKK